MDGEVLKKEREKEKRKRTKIINIYNKVGVVSHRGARYREVPVSGESDKRGFTLHSQYSYCSTPRGNANEQSKYVGARPSGSGDSDCEMDGQLVLALPQLTVFLIPSYIYMSNT